MIENQNAIKMKLNPKHTDTHTHTHTHTHCICDIHFGVIETLQKNKRKRKEKKWQQRKHFLGRRKFPKWTWKNHPDPISIELFDNGDEGGKKTTTFCVWISLGSKLKRKFGHQPMEKWSTTAKSSNIWQNNCSKWKIQTNKKVFVIVFLAKLNYDFFLVLF